MKERAARYNIPNSSSGSTQLRSAPLGFEYTGSYSHSSGSLEGVDSSGGYWSRFATSDGDGAYLLIFDSSHVWPQYTNGRGYGFAARCVEGIDGERFLNFLRTGYYDRSNGYINYRIIDGGWWSITNDSDTLGRYLYIYPEDVNPQSYGARGVGFAIRCVEELSQLSPYGILLPFEWLHLPSHRRK